MRHSFDRMLLLTGERAFDKISASKVCVFGCGGVGSYVIEALARSGVGSITIVDNDVVEDSNINRQLIALYSTVGQDKVQAEKQRILDINPDCRVSAQKLFYDRNSSLDFSGFDYVIDAIDSVPSKVYLIQQAVKAGVPVISSMGTGNKLDPSKLQITDLFKTAYCPLAKKMRYELKKVGITHLKVVYSTEEPVVKSVPPGSCAFVPAAAGLLIASAVIRDIMES